jgi:glycosyltransferase involved in cell wall biosynthesis
MLKSIPVRDDVEVIMVNDGSTDSTKAIFEKFVKVFPKVKFLNHEKNLGIGKTRQDAQKMITGKYFVYGDADDLFLPDFNIIINKLHTKEYQNYDLITYKHIDRRVLSWFNIVAP